MSKSKSYLLPLMIVLSLLLCGCGPVNTLPNSVLERMLENSEKPTYTKYYQQTQIRTYYKGKLQSIQQSDLWEDLTTDRLRLDLIDSELGTFHTVIEKELMTLYRKGNSRVSINNINHLMVDKVLTNKEHSIQTMESIRRTYNIRLVGEDSISNQPCYKLVATPKNQKNKNDLQYLWINQENWMIMKRIITEGNTTVEMTVKNFDTFRKMENSIFQLSIPEKLVYQSIPSYQKKVISLTDISEPIFYLPQDGGFKPYSVNKIVSPFSGYELFYMDENNRTIQLKIIKRNKKNASLFNPQTFKEDLTFLDSRPVSIHPILNEGMQLSWTYNDFYYELVYFSPYVTKIELQQVINRLSKYNGK